MSFIRSLIAPSSHTPFQSLDRSYLSPIIDSEIEKINASLAHKQISLTLDEKAKEFLISKGFQPEMGARSLHRVIQQYLEDPLAEKRLLNPNQAEHWTVSVENDELVFIHRLSNS